MQFAARSSRPLSVGLLFGLGLSLGLAVSPTVVDPAMAQMHDVAAGGRRDGAGRCRPRRVGLRHPHGSCQASHGVWFWGTAFAHHVRRRCSIFLHIPAALFIDSILGLLIFAAPDHGRLSAASAIDGSPVPRLSSPRSNFLHAVNVFRLFGPRWAEA